jgi:Tol biopolymer transport system component
MRNFVTHLLALLFLAAVPAFAQDRPPTQQETDKDALLTLPERAWLKNIRQLTFEGTRSGEAYFSPDGKSMSFQSVRGDCPHYQIFLKHLDGTRLVRLSPGNGLTTCSYFHPFEQRVLWASTHLDPATYGPPPANQGRYVWDKHKSFDIFTSDLDGKNPIRLTKAPGYDAEGSYSSDGSRICFTSERDGDLEIYTMAADGSDVRRVTNSVGYDGGPFFSPDGKLITFRGFRDPENPRFANIYVIDADGSASLRTH